MLFNSLTFVVFYAVVTTLYWSLRGWNPRKNLLVVASYIFYGAWNPPFAALLFSTTAMDFWLGRQIGKAQGGRAKKRWLVASVCMNLSMLGFFKYGNFLLQNFQWLLARIGIIYQPPHLDILLPVGISFYTFHSLSYTLDIYRGVLKPTRSLRDFILAVSFFPQLVAGPIVRAGDFLPQLQHPPRLKTNQFLWGLALMTLGLFEKIVLADTLLSTFLRDYLYIPLGGNQVRPFRMALNLVIVMFLGGLWHGAAWTFVVWGLLHGSYLVIERVFRIFFEQKPWAGTLPVRLLVGFGTYVAVCIAWVFFRASDFTIASRVLTGMFGGHPDGDMILTTRELLQIGIVTAGLICVHWAMRGEAFETTVMRLPRLAVTAIWSFMACAIIFTQGSSNAFIYFQF
jgi:D-alanyl-lipoteichoic acid acyltransferase DltB (MBOAT superfamily)